MQLCLVPVLSAVQALTVERELLAAPVLPPYGSFTSESWSIT